jgi:hypothetical protein
MLCYKRTYVTGRSAVSGPLPLLNLAVVVLAGQAAVTAGARSGTYLLLPGWVAIVAAVAVLTFSRRARAHVASLRGRIPRGLVYVAATAPWLLLSSWIAMRGLWWTQRPAAIRFLAAYALLNWSIVCCFPAPAGSDRQRHVRGALLWLAAPLALLALDGVAFGVSAFGCALSALLGATAAFALCVATAGSMAACFKLFASAAATILALAVAETTVRLLHVGQNLQEVDRQQFARQFYSLTPPHAAFVNTPGLLDEFAPALVEINSLGIRGPEVADQRADLLLLGDSMIEARQLPWDRTVTARLQQALRDRSSAVRVVGHGMRGWSPLLEWNWYLKVGRQLRARTVLLFFFWNDLWTEGNEASTYRAVLNPDGRPDHFDVPVDSNWIWYKHVRVLRLAEDGWRRASMTELRRAFATMAARNASSGTLDVPSAQRVALELAGPPLTADEMGALLSQEEPHVPDHLRALVRQSFWPRVRPLRLWSEAQRAAADITELELQRFAEDVAADGGRLVLVHVPNPLQIGPAECAVGRLFERVPIDAVLPMESGIQTWLRQVADRHALEFLDPSAKMREALAEQPANPSPMYLRADCHWSERGHQFMAEYLAGWYTATAGNMSHLPTGFLRHPAPVPVR